MKKVDMAILQKMLDEGKPQREIAKHFGVSESAISQRVKRLHQNAPPESFANLSPKEQKFVLAKLEGKSGTAAALEAYDVGSIESAKAIGSKLSNDPDIEKAIADIMHEEGLGRRSLVKRLKDLVDSKDLGIAAKGLDMGFKVSNLYAPEKIDVQIDIRAITARADELLAMLKREGTEIIDLPQKPEGET
jgi:transposase